MSKRTEIILKILNVFAWFAFIGLMVQAGAFLFSYCYTLIKPEVAKDFYEHQNLYPLKQFSLFHYTTSVVLRAGIPILESYTAYLIIKVLSKIKLSSPFTMEVAGILEKISYFILATWIVAVVYNSHASWLIKEIPGLALSKVSGDFIFIAGVVFVFAQIFKKGVEIQTENDLTV